MEQATYADELVVGEYPSVTSLDVDLYAILGYKLVDGVGRQGAAPFPDALGVLLADADDQIAWAEAGDPHCRGQRMNEPQNRTL